MEDPPEPDGRTEWTQADSYMLRPGIPRSLGNLLEIQTQRLFVCGFLVCGLALSLSLSLSLSPSLRFNLHPDLDLNLGPKPDLAPGRTLLVCGLQMHGPADGA